MIDVISFNIASLNKDQFKHLLTHLPKELQQEILQYRLIKDQMLKLIGKLIVKSYHLKNNYKFDWKNWEVSKHNKPSLKQGLHFNISHSEDWVVVAFSKYPIGIDIELKQDINWSDLISSFHINEQEFMENSLQKLNDFYKIWTRKESFLKAIGIGMSNGLSHYNCLESTLYNAKNWKIQPFNFNSNYAAAICSSVEIKMDLKEWLITDL